MPRCGDSLCAAITARRAAGDWQATEKLSMRCLELDPLNELATLAYAESIAMDGSKARAIAVLDRYSAEIGPASKQIREPMLALRQRIIDLYPVPPVIEVEPPQIGREEEMSKLDAALSEAREGHGSAYVISGPPGIGKTRLVTEFTRAAELKGVKIARTNMGRHDDHRPLGAWSDLVPALRRMPGAVGIDPESIPYLKRLTGHDAKQDSPSAESQDAEYLFARIRLSIVDLVAAVASESCAILLIEDIHWMDEWSWDVMAALSKKLATTGVLVLMTRRDSEDGSTSIPKDAAVRMMPLAALSNSYCRRLFGHVGPAKRSSEEEFIEWCVRTSAGNPYFLIELGRRASKADGRFQAPPSLTKLISERFLDVTPLSRRVLQVTAVLGRHSTIVRIEKVLDERRISLLDSLDELSRHSLIVSEGERVICRHDLLGMSALSDVSPFSLRLIHRHSAAVLEAEINDSSEVGHLWDCARHLESANERHLALRMLERCSIRAISMGVPRDAIRVLEFAISLDPTGEMHTRLLRRLVSALYFVRDYPQCVALYAQLRIAESDSLRVVPHHSEQELYAVDASHYSTGPSSIGLERSMACVLDGRATPEHRVEAALVAVKLASNLFARPEGEKAFSVVEPLLELVDPALSTEFLLVYEGSFGTAIACGAAAVRLRNILRETQSPGLRFRSIGQCAEGLHIGGCTAEALELVEEAISLSEKISLARGNRWARQLRTRFQLALGDTKGARNSLVLVDTDDDAFSPVEAIRGFEYAARLALLEEDYDSAALFLERLHKTMDFAWPRAIRHHSGLTALLRIRRDGWLPSNDEMARLVEVHIEGRGEIHHDFYLYAISYAFEVRGEWSRFLQLSTEYVDKFRFERSAILLQLSERMALHLK